MGLDLTLEVELEYSLFLVISGKDSSENNKIMLDKICQNSLLKKKKSKN